jgi:predicted RNA-binding protein YlqC (UPF0109 family)
LPASLEGLITYLAKGIVDRPDQVELRAKEVEGAKVFELKVAPEDVGKVIGRSGRIANALRVLIKTASARNNRRAILEIV